LENTRQVKGHTKAMSDQIRTLTNAEMQALKMNDRQFAEHLTEKLSQEGDNTLSHATVINWRKHGKPPATDFLEDLIAVYPVSDRRFLFALRLLALKSPHIWGEGGIVWTLKKNPLSGAE
jgi:hypothetical protein